MLHIYKIIKYTDNIDDDDDDENDDDENDDDAFQIKWIYYSLLCYVAPRVVRQKSSVRVENIFDSKTYVKKVGTSILDTLLRVENWNPLFSDHRNYILRFPCDLILK